MKKMSAKEFLEQGFLQELNRQFLHPMGLALEVIQEADGTFRFGDVQNFGDDLEGMVFDDSVLDTDEARAKCDAVVRRQQLCYLAREAALGFVIQPVPGKKEKK